MGAGQCFIRISANRFELSAKQIPVNDDTQYLCYHIAECHYVLGMIIKTMIFPTEPELQELTVCLMNPRMIE